MRKFITYLLFAALGIVLIVFFVANRQDVLISFDPTSTTDPAFFIGPMPMWAALVFTLLIGFVLGAFGMWLSAGSLRRKAKVRKKEIRRLEGELALAAGAPPSKSRLPTLRR